MNVGGMVRPFAAGFVTAIITVVVALGFATRDLAHHKRGDR